MNGCRNKEELLLLLQAVVVAAPRGGGVTHEDDDDDGRGEAQVPAADRCRQGKNERTTSSSPNRERGGTKSITKCYRRGRPRIVRLQDTRALVKIPEIRPRSLIHKICMVFLPFAET